MAVKNELRFLHAYIDDELDAAAVLEFDNALAASPGLRLELERLSVLRKAIRDRATRYRVPADLAERIIGEIPRAFERRSATRAVSRWRWVSVGACAAAVVLLAWNLQLLRRASSNGGLEEVVVAHVRSQMTGHLIDVESSNRHMVKPWLSSRLNFSPLVIDLGAAGYPLAGARLEYFDQVPAAAIVYRRDQHLINVFARPSESARQRGTLSMTNQRGFNIARFSADGIDYWVVSDLNPSELQNFASLLERSKE